MGEPGRLRFLAPLAVVVALVAVAIVVGTVSTGSPSHGSKGPTATTASKKPKKLPKFYVVKRGDTLSAIADKTGVPISVIEDLNPDLDPQTVRPGQRLRIRR